METFIFLLASILLLSLSSASMKTENGSEFLHSTQKTHANGNVPSQPSSQRWETRRGSGRRQLGKQSGRWHGKEAEAVLRFVKMPFYAKYPLKIFDIVRKNFS